MRPRIALIVASLGAFAGCSSTVLSDPHRTETCYRSHIDERVLQQELDLASPCCANFAGMPFERLTWQKTDTTGGREGPLPPAPTVNEFPFSVAISRRSPAYPFSSGKSRFVAIDLTALERQPTSFTVVPKRSGVTGGVDPCGPCSPPAGVPGTARYVTPVATFLDSRGSATAQAVVGKPVVLMTNGGLRFEVPRETRYLVLHTDPSDYGKQVSLPGRRGVTLLLLPSGAIVPVPYDGSRDGLIAATGSVDLHFHYGPADRK